MSIPQLQTVHGVTVRKLPIGKYIQVLQAMEDLPALLVGQIFPGAENTRDLIARLISADTDTIIDLLGRLLTVVPEQCCRILSDLLDIPLDRLLDPASKDPLSLNEVMDIIMAYWEANDYSNFFARVRLLRSRTSARKTQTTQSTGSSAG